MSDQSLWVRIFGDASGAQAAMSQASASVKDGVAQMREHADALTSAFGKITTIMAGVTAVLAGGEAFKEAITETVNLTKESQKLGKQLGMTTTEASQLAVALGDAYVDADTFAYASNRVTMTLKTNEEAFTALGVQTRDANGHFRNSTDVLMDVNTALGKYKEGVDRNLEGQKLFGRAWGEVAATMRVTREGLEAAAQKADELGLTIGQRNVANVAAYRASMNDVNDVITAVKKAMGEALLPILTEAGNWFASIGPTAVKATKDAMLALVIVIESVETAVKSVWAIVSGFVAEFTVAFLSVGDALNKALHGDFSGAGQALQAGGEQMVDIAKEKAGNIADAFTDAQKRVADAMTGAFDKDPATQAKGGGLTSAGGESKMPKYEAALAAQREALALGKEMDGEYHEFGKQQEIDYWKAILETRSASLEDTKAIQKKLTALEVEQAKERFAGQVAAMKTELANYRASVDEKIAIAEAIAEKIGNAYGKESTQYAEAQRQIVELERQKAEQIKAIEQSIVATKRSMALAAIDADEQEAKLKTDIGQQTSLDLLKQEEKFENQRYAIKEQALRDTLALMAQDPNSDPVKKAAIDAEIEALEEAHQARMRQIKGATVVQEAEWQTKLRSDIQSGYQQTLTKFLSGQATVLQTLRSLVQNIKQAIIQVLAELMAKQLAQSTLSIILAKKEMIVHAALAAIHAAKSAAQIPFVGWALAIGAAVAVFAGLKAMSSAAGGYDIPPGVNPVTQLHQREMVLPAKHADVIRSMADNGGGAPRGGDTHHWHLHMIDGSGAEDFIRRNGTAIAKELTSQYRHGFPLPR